MLSWNNRKLFLVLIFHFAIGSFVYGGLENFWTEFEYLSDDGSRRFVIMPYLKIGINQSQKDKFAGLGQCIYLFPYSVLIIYSPDFKKLTTYLSLKKVLYRGRQDDDPIGEFRFDESHQSIMVFSIGTELPIKLKPGILESLIKTESL